MTEHSPIPTIQDLARHFSIPSDILDSVVAGSYSSLPRKSYLAPQPVDDIDAEFEEPQ